MSLNIMIEENESIKQTILELSNGSQRAFRCLYDYYYLRLYKFLCYYTKNQTDCEEILSEVFSIVWLNRERLTQIEFIDAYLYQICRNEAFHYFKKNKKTNVELIDDLSVMLEYIPMENDDPLLEAEMENVYQEAIDSLPEKCKLIFLMIREQKLSYKIAAKILNITEGTIEVQINIATKRIMNHVQKYFPEIKRKNN